MGSQSKYRGETSQHNRESSDSKQQNNRQETHHKVMAGSDNFCLKWNDHHSVFFSNAEQPCKDNSLTDVVLSAGGTFFRAHKLVLSVCSKYFQELFSQPQPGGTQNSTTVIYLKDVAAAQMQMLLSYMYRGEVDVSDDELGDFLQTASGLQIKGLSNNEKEEKVERKKQQQQPRPKPLPTIPEVLPVPVTPVVDSSSRKRPELPSMVELPQTKRIKEETRYAENEPSSTWQKEGEIEEYRMIEEGQSTYSEPDFSGYEGEMAGYEDVQTYGNEVGEWKLQHPGDQLTERLNKAYKCSLCLKTFSLRDSCQRHLKTVHKEVNSLP